MTEDTCPDCEAGNLCGDAMTESPEDLGLGGYGAVGPIAFPAVNEDGEVVDMAASMIESLAENAARIQADFDKLVAYLVREHGIGHKAIKRILEKD